MNKKFIILLVIALIAVFSAHSQSALSGTYRYNERYYITFTGNTFTGAWGNTPLSGIYALSVTGRLTLYRSDEVIWNWSIYNENTIFDHTGDVWNKEKQEE